MARLNKGLIYTNDNCIGCNRCISGCPVLGANISSLRNGKNRIMVDGSKCIHCGHCISMCKHNAREYIDDTEIFLKELNAGETISLAVAPSFYMDFGEKAFHILGYLKSLGIYHIYNVSFGADIATWAYLCYKEKQPDKGMIATSCPAVVNFVEHRRPELITRLMPVKSPLQCLATYLYKYQNQTEKLAFISPCIAKKDEIEQETSLSNVKYNVTYDHLLRELSDIDLSGYYAKPEILDFGFGNIFSISGGLKKNIENFVGNEKIVWEMNGVENIYPCMEQFPEENVYKEKGLFLYDVLNCEGGCNCGPGSGLPIEQLKNSFGKEQLLLAGMEEVSRKDTPFEKGISCTERFERIKRTFADLELEDFMVRFQNYSQPESEVAPDRLEEIYRSLHKIQQTDRQINCHSCGYNSCEQMAVAIAKGYNVASNCVHFAKDENMRMLLTDRMTGMPTMFAMEQFLAELILEDEIRDYVVVYFNIKDFTLINEQFGTRGGDHALMEYARQAERVANPDELVARIGGNNFIMAAKKENCADRLRVLNAVPLHLNEEDREEEYMVSIRGGIYCTTGEEKESSDIISRASIAFSIARKSENEDFIYFDDKVQQALLDDMHMSRIIPTALKALEFTVYYQPKVSIDGTKIKGAEALVRWLRNGKVIPPDKFIPLCERNGLVKQIDFYVLNRVCRDIRYWLDHDIMPVRISSNFSRQHFIEPGIAEKIRQTVDDYQIPHELIEVEFTETAYIEGHNELENEINKLKEYGFYSSMDDFGSGYSSLHLLQNLNFDVLKLDKSLLGNHIESEKTQQIMANIIRMAKDLQMETLAEGVETKDEFHFLKGLGCDVVQGYLFDRPLPMEQFEERLQKREY